MCCVLPVCLYSCINTANIDRGRSELIRVVVMVGREKEGGRAILVPWWYWAAGLYSHIMANNIEPRLRQCSISINK